MSQHHEHHHEHIEQLSADLLDQISGGATQYDTELAKLYVAAAKHDNVGLDDAIALIKKYNTSADLAKGGIDLDEVIKEMRAQW